MDCVIVGDSIADGIHQHAPRCAAIAKRGISSARWRAMHGAYRVVARRVVISLGSNDGGQRDAAVLKAVRRQIAADRVVWIVPACNARAAQAVTAVARRHGDATLKIRALERDGKHPTAGEYAALAVRAGLQG